MSKFDEAVDKYHSQMTELGMGSVDKVLLTKVTKGLGPSIYNADSSRVACTDPTELARVKDNFVNGKLGVTDDKAADAAIQEVCAAYNSNYKWRAVFYYLLTKKLGKEAIYG